MPINTFKRKEKTMYMKNTPIKLILFIILFGGLVSTPLMSNAASALEQAVTGTVKGKVMGISKKAKTISIQDKQGMVMLNYNDATKGMEHLQKGHASIITYAMHDGAKIAKTIKPKLAKLPKGVTEIKPDELASLIAKGPEAGSYFLADARPASRYKAGHVPTAVSLPVNKLKEKGETALPADKDTLVVFYCGGVTCGLSTKNAGTAKKLGYNNVKVMLVGAPGWKKSGRTLVAADSFIENGNIVLVDLRDSESAVKGHIARAVTVPFDTLSDMEEMFPSNTSAPVVVYGDHAEKAAKTIGKWGFKTVSLIDGGLEGWTNRGHDLVSGEMPEDIEWVRIPVKDEVTIRNFQKVVSNNSADAVILDVRNTDEAADGMFPGAINIPLDQIEARIAQLPKDKEILVHCSTGARAEMACQQLKKAGYKSKYLVADITSKNGSCIIND